MFNIKKKFLSLFVIFFFLFPINVFAGIIQGNYKPLKFESISALKTMTGIPVANQIVNVLGYYVATENQDWRFQWDSTSTAADDDGTIIKVTSIATGRWLRLDPIPINPDFFGAKPNNLTFDSHGAIEAALAVSSELQFSGASYRIDSAINIDIATLGRSPFNINIKGVQNITKLYGYGAINMLEIGDGTNPVIAGNVSNIEFVAGDTTVLRAIYGRNLREFDFENITFTGVDDSNRSFQTAGMELWFSWRVNIYNLYGLYIAGDGLLLGDGSVGSEVNAVNIIGGKMNRLDGRAYISYGAGHTYSGVSGEAAKGGGMYSLYCPGLMVFGGYFEQCGETSGKTFSISTSQNGGIISGVYIAAAFAAHHMIDLVDVNGFSIIGNNFTNLNATSFGVYTGASVAGVSLINNINESGTGTTYGGTTYPASSSFENSNISTKVSPLDINGGTIISKHISTTDTLTPAVIPSVPGYIDAAIFVSGAAVGDTVVVGGPAWQAGLIVTAFVAGVNQVNVRWTQVVGVAVTPTPGTYRVDIWKH